MRKLALVGAAGLMSGCALFNPYDSEFKCSATDDYGRCVDVDEAYADALAGRKVQRRLRDRKSSADDDQTVADQTAREAQQAASYSAYKDAEYREMRKLLDQPVTPLVKPPKVLRTLITAYPSNERTLYTPRYVFYFADEGKFVLGDYLNAAPGNTPDNLMPFGAK